MLMGVSVKMVDKLLCKWCQSCLFDNFKVELQIQQKNLSSLQRAEVGKDTCKDFSNL